MPEERGAAKSGALGDVVDGGLLVAALVEQRERGLGQPFSRRWLAHDRQCIPHLAPGCPCDRERYSVLSIRYSIPYVEVVAHALRVVWGAHQPHETL